MHPLIFIYEFLNTPIKSFRFILAYDVNDLIQHIKILDFRSMNKVNILFMYFNIASYWYLINVKILVPTQ